ncbi:hypothetical protein COCSUDRAFT_62212 [Coccomyxa subellipsoidea C-169]|uniref:Uncharacterized protein n=1 Tax=Coccomyxa subellipsoidea (strain C-169) TaxID=574566 RepID=I0Z2D6_COCSC|nr:hypothetical protein COCSUDRAFT_62212 [Coccomyxa subellipsoidea C-169]EIE24805.1 hypothetical protein COCSUDRAFT_62212 [Coccomyxa subellipsoidea C-169]|eukprot:XP_005649349.1 hypothetical protein COCSUDRAFT_62212 [Coccomyxa subellipsoidea C-169]
MLKILAATSAGEAVAAGKGATVSSGGCLTPHCKAAKPPDEGRIEDGGAPDDAKFIKEHREYTEHLTMEQCDEILRKHDEE